MYFNLMMNILKSFAVSTGEFILCDGECCLNLKKYMEKKLKWGHFGLLLEQNMFILDDEVHTPAFDFQFSSENVRLWALSTLKKPLSKI